MRGSRVSTPTTTSTSGRCSSSCAARPPQYVLNPVTRTRMSAEPHAAAGAEHVVEGFLHGDADALRLVHHAAARIALLAGCDVEVHGREHPQSEFRGEVADEPERAHQQHVGG